MQSIKSIKSQVHKENPLEGLYGLLAFGLSDRRERV